MKEIEEIGFGELWGSHIGTHGLTTIGQRVNVPEVLIDSHLEIGISRQLSEPEKSMWALRRAVQLLQQYQTVGDLLFALYRYRHKHLVVPIPPGDAAPRFLVYLKELQDQTPADDIERLGFYNIIHMECQDLDKIANQGLKDFLMLGRLYSIGTDEYLTVLKNAVAAQSAVLAVKHEEELEAMRQMQFRQQFGRGLLGPTPDLNRPLTPPRR